MDIVSSLNHELEKSFAQGKRATVVTLDLIAIVESIGGSVESTPEALQVLATNQRSWLLILDNADNPDFDYQVYFPPGNYGAVFMTSRVAERRLYSPDAFQALECLEEQYLKELLLKAAELAPGYGRFMIPPIPPQRSSQPPWIVYACPNKGWSVHQSRPLLAPPIS
ncbi:hypothetical protein BJ878DRAFT_541343 [Calycina marina]|uniref:Uncharacterized protein n=1 Tax=Calycina marina TaxID=1763456 RepID=A0A9P7Z501_9HELO|nr:hypothetical protein BJ878DRAFT_541343 [Calycina marina]